jgi:hypothetical protein
MADEDALRRIFAERDAAAAQAEANAKAAKEAQEQRNRQYARYGAVALLVLAVAVGGIWYSNRGDNGSADTAGGELACTLAMGGVGLLVAGFTHHQTPAAIFAEVAVPAIGGYACQQAIDTMAKSPTEPVTITVTGDGQSMTRTLTLNDLIAPTPPPTTMAPQTDEGIDRILYCWRTYELSSFQYELCQAGIG